MESLVTVVDRVVKVKSVYIKTGEAYTDDSMACLGIAAVYNPRYTGDRYSAHVYIGTDDVTQSFTAEDCVDAAKFFTDLATALSAKDKANK